jgi:ribosomal protein S6--L-glutamate ligase
MHRIGVVGAPDGWSSERLADALAERAGERHLIDITKVTLDLESGAAWHGELDITGLDALAVKKVGARYSPTHLDWLEILRFVSGRGVRVFSDAERIARVIDRLSCTVTLRLSGIPMPPTIITSDVSKALESIERFEIAVLKPLFSSKARGMCLVRPGASAATEIEEFRAAGNPVMYIQKLMDPPERDLGIVFMGGEYVASYARVRNHRSWNTTTRSGGRYESADPSPEVVELARRAQAPFGLDFTSVDVMETARGPLVLEVSAFGGFRGLFEARAIDAAALYADYVLERLSDG